ncbi:unnamed protein product [Cunninghamella blakesleeana]
MSNNSHFNPAPILLRHPSSLMIDDNLMYHHQDSTKANYVASPTSPEIDTLFDVPQHLDPEQHQYEFPPKSHLQALSEQLDNSIEDSLSFFDASSFTTTSCTSYTSSHVSLMSDEFNAQEDQEFNSFLATLELEQQQHNSSNEQSTFSLSPPMMESPLQQYRSYEEEEEQQHYSSLTNQLVHDRHLSPLQLPQQVTHPYHQDPLSSNRLREESYDSISTITQPIVAPSSFLTQHDIENDYDHDHRRHHMGYRNHYDDEKNDDGSDIEWYDSFYHHQQQQQHQQHQSLNWKDPYMYYDGVHPYHRSSEDMELPMIHHETNLILSSDEDEEEDSRTDHSSTFSSGSKVVLIKLNKKNKVASPYIPRYISSTSFHSDEGYDDDEFEDDKELPIESASIFLPLQPNEPLSENENKLLLDHSPSSTYYHPSQVQQQQRNEYDEQFEQMQKRIQQLESNLREEKAMRNAFEKAMEEMVLLMDQQQKMLYDRVEQEVTMRQVYERKMNEALQSVAPLESKLKKETDARCELESMMSHVLNQLQDLKTTQEKQQQQLLTSSRSSMSSSTTKSSIIKKKVANNTVTKTILTHPSSSPSVSSKSTLQRKTPLNNKQHRSRLITTTTNTPSSTTTTTTNRLKTSSSRRPVTPLTRK